MCVCACVCVYYIKKFISIIVHCVCVCACVLHIIVNQYVSYEEEDTYVI